MIVCRIQKGVSLRSLAALHALYSTIVFGGKDKNHIEILEIPWAS
jgi:hypothetical protein